jgi:hypothetical protein
VGSGLKNPADFVGIHHFGFQCDDLARQQKQIEQAGGTFFFDLGDPDDDDFERKFKDPNGIIFDVNWKGWTMTSGKMKGRQAASASRRAGAKERPRGKPVARRSAAAKRGDAPARRSSTKTRRPKRKA